MRRYISVWSISVGKLVFKLFIANFRLPKTSWKTVSSLRPAATKYWSPKLLKICLTTKSLHCPWFIGYWSVQKCYPDHTRSLHDHFSWDNADGMCVHRHTSQEVRGLQSHWVGKAIIFPAKAIFSSRSQQPKMKYIHIFVFIKRKTGIHSI